MRIKTIVLTSIVLTKSLCFAATVKPNGKLIQDFVPTSTTDKAVVGYFHKLLPTTAINKVYSTPYPDTYALVIGPNIVYGNLHSNYLTVGHMFNVYTKDDITDRLLKQNTPKIDISKINISDAIKIAAPTTVNKKLIIFIDPDCPYCRSLETQIKMQQLSNKADIYYMLMPLTMHPNAKAHSKNILCSKDPINTLMEYMVNNNESPTFESIANCNIEPVLERTGSIARSLSISGTPTIITGDGELITGSDINAINNYLNSK
jgi:thiol:disulfide interchange protein DsbC